MYKREENAILALRISVKLFIYLFNLIYFFTNSE